MSCTRLSAWSFLTGFKGAIVTKNRDARRDEVIKVAQLPTNEFSYRHVRNMDAKEQKGNSTRGKRKVRLKLIPTPSRLRDVGKEIDNKRSPAASSASPYQLQSRKCYHSQKYSPFRVLSLLWEVSRVIVSADM